MFGSWNQWKCSPRPFQVSRTRSLCPTVIGGVAWVGICIGAGYAFGNVPIVKNNFSLVALGIVVVSVLPMAIDLWRRWRQRP